MFIVHKTRGGKPQITSDNNRTKDGFLNNHLSREGWRIATEEEIKAHYPQYKPAKKVSKPVKKDEPKETEEKK
jgi:hypothetical protein